MQAETMALHALEGVTGEKDQLVGHYVGREVIGINGKETHDTEELGKICRGLQDPAIQLAPRAARTFLQSKKMGTGSRIDYIWASARVAEMTANYDPTRSIGGVKQHKALAVTLQTPPEGQTKVVQRRPKEYPIEDWGKWLKEREWALAEAIRDEHVKERRAILKEGKMERM